MIFLIYDIPWRTEIHCVCFFKFAELLMILPYCQGYFSCYLKRSVFVLLSRNNYIRVA